MPKTLLNRIGEIHKNTQGTYMKIVKYIGARDMSVEFQDEYRSIVNCDYKEFLSGKVKNPYDKKVFDVGFLGIGDFIPYENGNKSISYKCWIGMIERCYNIQSLINAPTYKGCTVCNE